MPDIRPPDYQPQSTAMRRAGHLPDWPKAMDAELASAYCSISPNTLRQHGPKPVTIGGRKLYLRNQLDMWLDGLAGITPTSEEERNPWDDL